MRTIGSRAIVWGPAALSAVALATASALLSPAGVHLPPPWVLLAFCALITLAELAAVPLPLGGFVTPAALLLLPGMVRVGPIPTALCAAIAIVLTNGRDRRPPDVIVFNAGVRTLSVLLAWLAWSAVLPHRPSFGGPALPLLADPVLPALAAAVFTSAATTTLLVSTFTAVRRNNMFRAVLRRNGPQQALTHVVFGISGMAAVLPEADLPAGVGVDVHVMVMIAGFLALLYLLRGQIAREMQALHGVVLEVQDTLELHGVLNRFADRVEDLAAPDMLWVELRGADETVEVPLARGVAPAALAPLATNFTAGAAAWALEHRRPLRIADYETYAQRRPEVEQAFGPGRVRSALVVPLVAGDEPLGVVALTRGIRDYFTPYQERTIRALAGQAALAVKNARLYESSQRTLARVQALRQVALAPASGADLGAIQQMIVDLAVKTLGADRGHLSVYDAEVRVLRGSAFNNFTPEDAAAWSTTIPATDGRMYASVRAIQELEPVAITDRYEIADAPPVPLYWSRAVLAVPMIVQGRPVGVLAVGRTGAHAWTQEEIGVAQAFAGEGAIVTENARLVQATRRQLQRMTALERISEQINSQRDLTAIFDLIADSAGEILGAERCTVLLGAIGRPPSHLFARGMPEEYLQVGADNVIAAKGPTAAAMQRREPVVIPDVLSDPRGEIVREWARRLGYRTLAVFPLLYRERVIGALRLYHDAVRPYGPDEIDLVIAFANQAAIAVENTRLLQEAEHRAHQFRLLNRTVTRITTSLRPEDLYTAVVEELHTTLNYPFVGVLEVRGDIIRAVARRGYAPGFSVFSINEGICGRVARTGQPAFVEDVRRDPDYLSTDDRITQEACVPIVRDGRVAALINVEVVEPTLAQSDMDVLTALASEVSAALHNAALFNEVQQARDELAALYEAAQALSASLESSAVLDALASVTSRRFGYERVAIFLRDEAAGDLEMRAAHGYPAPAGERVAPGEGAEGRAAREGRQVLVTTVPGPGGTGPARSTLAVPLTREGRVIGVFSVGRDAPDALGERDQHILTTLAGYAAVAIENARLYEQTRVLAITDGLTGLHNHRAAIEAVDQELERARRYTLPLGVVMIEIDRFKRYNDTYGHLRGDDVLRQVARVLEREHRKSIDMVARYGGDEFLIVLPHTPKAVAADVAERVRRAVETTPFIVGGQVTSVTLSLGVASFPDDGDTTITLVDAADRGMYAAKQLGGNAVSLATS